MFLVTYRSPASHTGVGSSIVDDVATFSMGRDVLSVTPYNREDDSILTPSVIQACNGSSDSL